MPIVEASVAIAAPRDVVREVIADPTRHSEFGTFVSEVVVASADPIGQGTVYRETSGPGIFKSKSQWTITEFKSARATVGSGGRQKHAQARNEADA